MAQKNKLDRLHEADVISKHDLNDEQKKTVEEMTEQEVTVLIGLRKRLGPAKPGQERIKLNFPL
jgi:hypothetical protein